MTVVIANMSMSLDGFIADPSDGVEHLFKWYGNGDVPVPTAQPDRTFRTSAASAEHLREAFDTIGALVSGRRLFDLTGGWGGNHPAGVPVFVVTHNVPDGWPRDDAPFTFVTSGVESAIEQANATAGDKYVGVASANIAQQCLNAGLLDEIRVDLIPVLLGDGIRFFDNLKDTRPSGRTEGYRGHRRHPPALPRPPGRRNLMNRSLEVAQIPISDDERAASFYATTCSRSASATSERG